VVGERMLGISKLSRWVQSPSASVPP
jgi:hypothetical protein